MHSGYNLKNTYIFENLIGSGGMGEVWSAKRIELGDRVAIKVLKLSNFQEKEVAREKLIKEAKITSLLNHPNVCKVFEFIEQDNVCFLVMELLQGSDLQLIIKNIHKYNESERVKLAIFVARNVLKALDFAHNLNHPIVSRVLHRDIKPANIFLTIHGEVKLLDLGIAKVETDFDNTKTSSSFYSLHYTNPDLWENGIYKIEKYSAKNDLFSLGLVCYEIIRGERAFEGEGRILYENIEKGKIQPIRLSKDFNQVSSLFQNWIGDKNSNHFNQTGELLKEMNSIGLVLGVEESVVLNLFKTKDFSEKIITVNDVLDTKKEIRHISKKKIALVLILSTAFIFLFFLINRKNAVINEAVSITPEKEKNNLIILSDDQRKRALEVTTKVITKPDLEKPNVRLKDKDKFSEQATSNDSSNGESLEQDSVETRNRKMPWLPAGSDLKFEDLNISKDKIRLKFTNGISVSLNDSKKDFSNLKGLSCSRIDNDRQNCFLMSKVQYGANDSFMLTLAFIAEKITQISFGIYGEKNHEKIDKIKSIKGINSTINTSGLFHPTKNETVSLNYPVEDFVMLVIMPSHNVNQEPAQANELNKDELNKENQKRSTNFSFKIPSQQLLDIAFKLGPDSAESIKSKLTCAIKPQSENIECVGMSSTTLATESDYMVNVFFSSFGVESIQFIFKSQMLLKKLVDDIENNQGFVKEIDFQYNKVWKSKDEVIELSTSNNYLLKLKRNI